jgi:hypothetical protein
MFASTTSFIAQSLRRCSINPSTQFPNIFRKYFLFFRLFEQFPELFFPFHARDDSLSCYFAPTDLGEVAHLLVRLVRNSKRHVRHSCRYVITHIYVLLSLCGCLVIAGAFAAGLLLRRRYLCQRFDENEIFAVAGETALTRRDERLFTATESLGETTACEDSCFSMRVRHAHQE